MSNPIFTIGITTYQRPQMLKECVLSILAQTEKRFQVIIGNDDVAGPLSLEDLGIHDPRVTLLNRTINLRELPNMNDLLARAQTPYFTWLADDDCLHPRYLEKMGQALQTSAALSVVLCDYVQFEKNYAPASQVHEAPEILPGATFLSLFLEQKIKTLGCYGVWRAEVLRSFGGMKQLGNGFSPYSDFLLTLYASSHEQVGWLSAPLIGYRTHEQSLSWTSGDWRAYFTAQQDLCQQAREIFQKPHLRPRFDEYFSLMFDHWGIQYFFSVARRSDGHKKEALQAYFPFFLQQNKGLGFTARAKLWARYASLSLRSLRP